MRMVMRASTRHLATDAKKKVEEVYTHGHHASVVSQHAKRTVENSAAYLLRSGVLDKTSTKLLDVGCGPGSITVGFSKYCSTVLGVDAVASVVETAQQRVHDKCVAFQVGDVYALPFEAETFDVVHAHQVLQHLVDPVAAIQEMSRVLKKNGTLAVRDADYRSMLVHPPVPEVDLWRRVYRETCLRNKAQPDAGSYLREWFLQAGFEERNLQTTLSVVPYVTREECRDWGYAWKDRALHSDFARQAVEYGLATQQELESISAGWARWAELPGSMFYYVNGEMLATK